MSWQVAAQDGRWTVYILGSFVFADIGPLISRCRVPATIPYWLVIVICLHVLDSLWEVDHHAIHNPHDVSLLYTGTGYGTCWQC